MAGIRELSMSGNNEEVNALMTKFWEAHDKLYVDMDNLSYEEFKIRSKEMWNICNKTVDVDGTIFMITLDSMPEKANKLYGNRINTDIFPLVFETSKGSGNEIGGSNPSICTKLFFKIKKWFHSLTG
jgi:hypothetical protein